MLLSWEYLLVEFVTEGLVKHDVLLQSLVSDPSLRESFWSISKSGGEDLLGDKGDLSPHVCHPACPTHLAKQCREEGRLASTHLCGQQHFNWLPLG